ncbi:oxidoreductase [Chitinophaga deserti]|uniref:oxidoreductase n=1 Tax=Chitinophaga deserti TaxID=2164099 RepID=UPI000D6CAF4E|nr:oxidoreductase [Chitinophaga deserti]
MSKVVLVTGASAGIGKATAKHLAAKGYTVYGAARRVQKMESLKALGVKVLEMDVTSEPSMAAGIKAILDAEGRIDVLVNNAGFGSYGAFEEIPLAEAKYQMEVNVFGAARVTQLVLPSMIANRFGKIINITSVGGKIASAFGAWYHASKFALEGLSDSLRNEVKQFGVDVIVVEPGGIKSEWGGIAAENLLKVSGNGRYSKTARDYADRLNAIEQSVGMDPEVIAEVIETAITAKEPETRYAAGYMANEILALRKTMTDKEMDNMLHNELLNTIKHDAGV